MKKIVIGLVLIINMFIMITTSRIVLHAEEGDQYTITYETNGGTTVDDYIVYLGLTFTQQIELSITADGVYSVYAADLNNDGYLDVLSASQFDNMIAWYKNNGDGTFTEQPEISTTASGAISVYAADLDNDGDMDVISANYYGSTIAWFKNNGDETFTEQTALSTSEELPFSVYAADLDNDGDMDVISPSGSESKIAWFMNDGSGNFVKQPAISVSSEKPISVYATDLDNDGYLDILSASWSDDIIAWYKNNGDGTFTEQAIISSDVDLARSVYAADLDNDGYIDVLSAGQSDNTIAWYKNNGDGTFTEQPEISSTVYGAMSVYSVDLDNDGDMDVLSASYSGNTIAWHENNGDGTFNEQTVISSTAFGAMTVYAADLDNDGDMDILDASYDSDMVVWFENSDDFCTIISPAETTRIGYTFDGWYSDITLINVFDFDTVISSDITLYAKWASVSQMIIFEENGGTIVTDIIQDFGVILTTPSNPTKEGYSFGGWYSDIGLTSAYIFPATMPLNTTIYAKWVEIEDDIEYVIEYVNYNGTVLQTADYDFGVDLTGVTAPTEPSRVGYTFDLWDYTLPGTMPENNITVTAIFDINTYEVTYLIDGIDTVVEHDYNTLLTEVPSTIKEGYTFVEWKVNNNKIDTSSYTVPANDVTITALFELNQDINTSEENDSNGILPLIGIGIIVIVLIGYYFKKRK